MSDETLYLYTSLTAGSSHIVTATARLETILKANKLPFKAVDVATDEAARKLWARRSKGRKLPGLVKFGSVIGDLEEIEEWNEFGELRMQVNSVEDLDTFPASTSATPSADTTTTAPAPTPGENPSTKQSTIKIQSPPAKEAGMDDSVTAAIKQAGEEAAAKAKGDGDNNEDVKQEPKPDTNPEKQHDTNTEQHPDTQKQVQTQDQEQSQEENVRPRRKSVDLAPEVPGKLDVLRPPLETAAESSENFHADNAEALGLIEHHRGSILSATSDEERALAHDLRKSVSEARADVADADHIVDDD